MSSGGKGSPLAPETEPRPFCSRDCSEPLYCARQGDVGADGRHERVWHLRELTEDCPGTVLSYHGTRDGDAASCREPLCVREN